MYKKIVIILFSLGIFAYSVYSINIFSNKLDNEMNQNLTEKDKLQKEDFIMGGLYVNQPVDEVIKIYGKPLEIQKILNGFRGSDKLLYYFPGVIITTSNIYKEVYQIVVNSKNIKTFRGISVGDKEQDVYKHYGKTEKIANKILRYQMDVNFETSDAQHILEFYIQNNKVSEIKIYMYYPY